MSEATHLALSNLGPAGSGAEALRPPPLPAAAFVFPAAGLGAEKKDVILAFCLGFLASAPAWEAAFRLRVDIMYVNITGLVGKETTKGESGDGAGLRCSWRKGSRRVEAENEAVVTIAQNQGNTIPKLPVKHNLYYEVGARVGSKSSLESGETWRRCKGVGGVGGKEVKINEQDKSQLPPKSISQRKEVQKTLPMQSSKLED